MSLKNNFWSTFDRNFDMFDKLFNDNLAFTNNLSTPYNTSLRDKNTYRVEVALAGYRKKDIAIFVENGTLTVDVNKSDEACSVNSEKQDKIKIESYPHYLHKGITSKNLHYTFGVPKNSTSFDAKFENGILTIDIITKDKEAEKVSVNIK